VFEVSGVSGDAASIVSRVRIHEAEVNLPLPSANQQMGTWRQELHEALVTNPCFPHDPPIRSSGAQVLASHPPSASPFRTSHLLRM
jgi:hypothetical protein